MILKEYNLSVRLPQEKAIDTGITLVQNDKDVYKLNVRIFDGVNEIDYSEVDSATITFLKKDNNVVQGNMAVEADQLSYTLGTNEIACPGKVLVGIQLFGSTERLSTARFVMNVERDLVTAEAVQSTSEFPILQQLKQDLEAIDVVELTNEFNTHKADGAPHPDAQTLVATDSASFGYKQILSFARNQYGNIDAGKRLRVRLKATDNCAPYINVVFTGSPQDIGKFSLGNKRLYARNIQATRWYDQQEFVGDFAGLVSSEIGWEHTGANGEIDIWVNHPNSTTASITRWAFVLEIYLGSPDSAKKSMWEVISATIEDIPAE